MEEQNQQEVKYVGVLYEAFPGEFPNRGFLYSYKTKLPLKEGQVVKAPVVNRNTGEYSLKTAKVINANMNPAEIDYPLEDLKEIVE